MLDVMFLAADGDPGSNLLTVIAPFAIMIAVFYFFLIRPQQKRTKSRNAMLAELQKGNKVTTIGGIHGEIVEITDDIVVLKVNDQTRMTFERSAVNAVKADDKAVKSS